MTTTTATIDRAEINRRNAQKSTGPRTPEGKNRSRFNAVKHGMTARTIVLPDEDANVLQFRLESWINDLQPQNEVEQHLVEQAVHASWRLERAERAEVARLSHIIETVPTEEANRQREEAAALGRRLFSDRDVNRDASLNREILNALLPGRKSTSRPLDVLDHPEAIVRRLESTAAGCQWLLDRWTELHDILNQAGTWTWAEKARAVRLLGKPPLNLTAQAWENECESRRASNCPEIDAQVSRQLDRQFDARLDGSVAAPLATLRSVAEAAIARLEPLAAEHRQRAEAEAARQADLLSFDFSAEGERLRRYQFSCTRTLFRSLDTLIKVRRSGLGATSEERTEGSEVMEQSSLSRVPCSVNPPADPQNPRNEPTAPSVDDGTPRNEPSPCSVFGSPCSVTPLVERENPRIEPTATPIGVIIRPRPPFHRTVLFAMTLVVLFSAAGQSHRKLRNEPTVPRVDLGNPRNEAIATPHRAAGIDAGPLNGPLESHAGSDGSLPSHGEPRPSRREDDHAHWQRQPTPFDGNQIESVVNASDSP